MQFKQLLNDDDAVSPVIGVILMVAITVILAAVIGTFVLGLGDQVQQTAPNAQWSFDYADDTNGGELDINHDGGDTLTNSTISLQNDGSTLTQDDLATGGTESWFTTGDEISAGDTATINGNNALNPSQNVRVIWTADGGDRSSTMATWEAP